MRILLTNDDGFGAEGLEALERAARDFGEIEVVAPDREQSGASHALTMNRPVRLRRIAQDRYSVDGTPTDCVLLAVRGFDGRLDRRPDLVLSGVNHGSNLGDDVTYSGTVAAAMEANLFGIPAIAFSLAAPSSKGDPIHWDTAVRVVRATLRSALARKDRILLNVNIPNLPFAELRGSVAARLGKRVYPRPLAVRHDPHGRPYYWLGDTHPEWEAGEDTDYAALSRGAVTLTPLHLDLTDHRALVGLSGPPIELGTEE